MSGTVISFIAGIFLTIFLVVGVHEFGHFFMARLLGIRVLKFSLGFGRKLVSIRDRKNTEYIIAALPLGGYVSLLEENDASPDEKHQVFTRQPFWKRFLVIAAGPLTNLLFALLLYWAIFITGFISILPVTGAISPHSIAANAGIKPNLQITQIDGVPVASWMAVIIQTLNHAGGHDTLEIRTETIHSHHSHTYTLNLTHWQLDPLKPDLLTSLGISPWFPKAVHTKTELPLRLPGWILHNNKYPPIEAFSHAWQNTKDFTLLNLRMTGRIITGKLSVKSLGGPISIFSEAGHAFHNGVVAFMSFLAFLSIAVGVINIFPIPGLDGGHLFFQIIEVIIRRPIPERIMTLFYRLGIFLIILLSVQAVINDLMRL